MVIKLFMVKTDVGEPSVFLGSVRENLDSHMHTSPDHATNGCINENKQTSQQRNKQKYQQIKTIQLIMI